MQTTEAETHVEINGMSIQPYKSLRGPSDLVDRHPLFQQIPSSRLTSDVLVEQRFAKELDGMAADLGRLRNVAANAGAANSEYVPAVRAEKTAAALKPTLDALGRHVSTIQTNAAQAVDRVNGYFKGALDSVRPKLTDVGDRMVAELRQQEIRQMLRALPREERVRRIAAAIPDAPNVLLAALDAPDVDDLLPETYRARFLHDFAVQRFPWLETMKSDNEFLAQQARSIGRGVEAAAAKIVADHGINLPIRLLATE